MKTFTFIRRQSSKYLLMSFMLLVGYGLMAQTATAPSGTGTGSDPYLIASLNNLYWIADQNNNDHTDFTGKYFKQTVNINASATSTWSNGSELGWDPIGNGSNTFYGSYDGQGYTISNLFISRSTDYIGLFGYCSTGTIENLGTTDVSFSGGYYTAGLIGVTGGSVLNCYSTGSIVGSDFSGGLIGYNMASVNNCYSTCSVDRISDGSSRMTYGGFIGTNDGGTINNCYATGTVTGGANTTDLGGFAGSITSGTITNCYSIGLVSPAGGSYYGGFSGTNYGGTATGCFWNTETSGQSTSVDGTGKTTAQMKTASTYTGAGWDFTGETANGTNDYWGIGSGYPYLLSQGLNITANDFASGSSDISAFTKTYLNTDFTITPASNNYSSIETNSGFNGFYSYDYSTANGTEFTISAPGYSFDLSSFKYYLESDRLPSLTVTLTFIDGSTDTKTYSFTGSSTGVYTFTSFTTTVNDVTSIKFVSDNYMTCNTFAISDIKALPCIWNGTAWSPSTPTATDDAIINATYNSTGITCNDLTINSGFQVTFSSDVTVTGNLLVKSGATLINEGTVSVTGTTTVEQNLTGAGTTTPSGRYWYVASPVSGATSTTFNAAGTDKLWYYDETAHGYSEITDNTTTLSKGTGYVARLGADQTVSFTGTLTSGTVSITPSRTGTSDAKRGYNLIGNPYLSYLNWNTAYASASNMLPTIWYRTVNSSSTMVFDTYNASSGVGTNNNGSGEVTRYIPPMQAVWVKVDADGNTGAISCTNAMRSHQTGSLKEDVAFPVVRLAVSNGTNSDEAVAVFADSASNGYDKFDSPKMSNNNVHVPELYMTADSEHVAINGLKPFEGTDTIVFGFHAFEKDTFSVSLPEFFGFEGYDAVLFDKVTGDSVVLNDSEYSFVADSSDDASRFVLVLKATTETTGVDPVAASGISVTTQNGAIVVSSNVVPATVSVSDVLGRAIVSSVVSVSPASFEVPISGVYFVTVSAGITKETVKVLVNK